MATTWRCSSTRSARAVQVQAYRMGYYQGLGGRLVWQSDSWRRRRSRRRSSRPGIGTVSCPWSPTMTITVAKDWPPGCYLLKLVGNGGEEQFVPLTVRDDTSMAAYVIQNSVTTWQAYNLWGDYSLYYGAIGHGWPGLRQPGPRSSPSTARTRRPGRPARPTSSATNCPLLFHLESLGLDLTYWTDVDLHERPAAARPTTAACSAWGTTSTGPRPMREARRSRQRPG